MIKKLIEHNITYNSEGDIRATDPLPVDKRDYRYDNIETVDEDEAGRVVN